MLKQLTEATKHVVGVKQTAKAVEKGTAKLVFIAADADIRISRPLLESCEAVGVKVITADSAFTLGLLPPRCLKTDRDFRQSGVFIIIQI